VNKNVVRDRSRKHDLLAPETALSFRKDMPTWSSLYDSLLTSRTIELILDLHLAQHGTRRSGLTSARTRLGNE
jgi:hypothetical protein